MPIIVNVACIIYLNQKQNMTIYYHKTCYLFSVKLFCVVYPIFIAYPVCITVLYTLLSSQRIVFFLLYVCNWHAVLRSQSLTDWECFNQTDTALTSRLEKSCWHTTIFMTLLSKIWSYHTYCTHECWRRVNSNDILFSLK